MGFLDVLFGAAEIVDMFIDHGTHFIVKCDTLELFENRFTMERNGASLWCRRSCAHHRCGLFNNGYNA